jgi:hypothetical protein
MNDLWLRMKNAWSEYQGLIIVLGVVMIIAPIAARLLGVNKVAIKRTYTRFRGYAGRTYRRFRRR